ncbi:MAG: hypothetical protein IAE90_11995 [Ignavibacteria bacterium]|nr:hypothetical protein [Ignavibacteria bacterium]
MNTSAKTSIFSSIITVLVIAVPLIILTQILGWNIGTAGVGILIGVLYAFIRYKKA